MLCFSFRSLSLTSLLLCVPLLLLRMTSCALSDSETLKLWDYASPQDRSQQFAICRSSAIIPFQTSSSSPVTFPPLLFFPPAQCLDQVNRHFKRRSTCEELFKEVTWRIAETESKEEGKRTLELWRPYCTRNGRSKFIRYAACWCSKSSAQQRENRTSSCEGGHSLPSSLSTYYRGELSTSSALSSRAIRVRYETGYRRCETATSCEKMVWSHVSKWGTKGDKTCLRWTTTCYDYSRRSEVIKDKSISGDLRRLNRTAINRKIREGEALSFIGSISSNVCILKTERKVRDEFSVETKSKGNERKLRGKLELFPSSLVPIHHSSFSPHPKDKVRISVLYSLRIPC